MNPTNRRAEVKTMKKQKELHYQFCSICQEQFHFPSEIQPHYEAHKNKVA
jgi:hypothetical protein